MENEEWRGRFKPGQTWRFLYDSCIHFDTATMQNFARLSPSGHASWPYGGQFRPPWWVCSTGKRGLVPNWPR